MHPLFSGFDLRRALERLEEHLERCIDCRRVFEECQEVVSMGLASLAPDFAALPAEGAGSQAENRAERRLLTRIENALVARGRGATVTGTLTGMQQPRERRGRVKVRAKQFAQNLPALPARTVGSWAAPLFFCGFRALALFRLADRRSIGKILRSASCDFRRYQVVRRNEIGF